MEVRLLSPAREHFGQADIQVAFLTSEPSSPRARLFRSAPGVEIVTRPRPWLRHGFARRFEAVVLHRRPPGGWGRRRLRKAAARLVFDVDRALFLRRTARGAQTSREALARFAGLVGSADLVTAANPYLAAYARKFTEDWRVKLVPEAVDPSAWKPRERALSRNRFVVGWMGPSDRLPDLQELAEALKRLCEVFPGLELRIVSDARPVLDGVRTSFSNLDPAREAEEIDAFDIALALYGDDALSLGETPRELLAYLAAGVPIVAIDSPAVRPIIRDHHNGLVAQSPDEWERKIGVLIEAPELAKQLSRGARETAEKVYAVDRVARGVASILRSLERIPPRVVG